MSYPTCSGAVGVEGTGGTLSVSLTIPSAGANKVLWAFAGCWNNPVKYCAGVTWNGTNVPWRRSAEYWQYSNTLYALTNPAPGTFNVVATFTGGSWNGILIAGYLTDAYQSAPDSIGNQGGTTPWSYTLTTSGSNSLLVASSFNGTGTWSTTAPGVNITNYGAGHKQYASRQQAATAGSHTITGTAPGGWCGVVGAWRYVAPPTKKKALYLPF